MSQYTLQGYIVWEYGEKLARSKSKKEGLMERLALKRIRCPLKALLIFFNLFTLALTGKIKTVGENKFRLFVLQ
jgi:hypothetical protein